MTKTAKDPNNHAQRMDRKYARVRHVYDLTRKYFLFGRDAAIDRMELGTAKNVLEIGCGTGRNLSVIASRHKNLDIRGVDISSEMLKSAARRIAKYHNANVTVADAATLDAEKAFGIRQFDALQPAFTMLPLCRHLAADGHSVVNIDYPSTSHPIERLAEIVAERIDEHAATVDGRLHLVGYSMGGLVIRAFLKDRVPVNLGKVVMIGTPNHGSEVADFLRSFPPFRYLYGPAGQQLVTDQKEFASIFANEGLDLGIIAGDSAFNPFLRHIIGKPSDGRVSVESTRLACAADHLVVHSNHTMLPHNPVVWRQTANFLRNGAFERAETSLPEFASS